ncbi:unnamed protein product [Victoria cruziana]
MGLLRIHDEHTETTNSWYHMMSIQNDEFVVLSTLLL